MLINWQLWGGVAAVVILSNGVSYCKGRMDGRAALEAEQLQANITGQNESIEGLRKADDPYENYIIPEIQKIPSVGKTCAAPPAAVSTIRVLPNPEWN